MNKKIINKSKYILFSLVVILLIGFGSFIYLARADDVDENKFTIKNVKIKEVTDGTAPFDDNNDVGNDSSNRNGIVRTFDTVSYKVDFDLTAKQVLDDQGNPVTDGENNLVYESVSLEDERSVIVDILIPNNVDCLVSTDSFDYHTFNLVFGNYKYYEYTTSYLPNEGISFDFYISNIYLNGDNRTITPLVIIRESTDADTKSITSLTEEELAGSYDSVSSQFNKSICTNLFEGSEVNSCDVTISGVEQYTGDLFLGRTSSEGLVTNVPVGFIFGLERRSTASEEDKGIKGLLYPNSIDLNVSTTNNEANVITYSDTVSNYNDSLGYRIYMDANDSYELPILNARNINGSVENGVLNISVTGIDSINTNSLVSYNEKSIYPLVSGSFIITSTRNSYTENKDDIPIAITATNNHMNSTVTANDRLNRYIGRYNSIINIYDVNSTSAKENDKVVLNYGQSFDIESIFSYGTSEGDGLDSLTNYLKVDNNAIKLLLNDDNNNYSINYSSDAEEYNSDEFKPKVNVTFGFGEWSADYFETPENAPSDCPAISSLNTNELMNLYGGPCVVEKSNVKWVTDLDSSELTEEEKSKGAILVKTILTPAEGKQYVYPSTKENMKLRARLKDDYNLASTSHQIVTSATAMFNDSTTSKLYYLSNTINRSDVDLMTNKNNYIMTNYDYANRALVGASSNTCQNIACAVNGNTILVSGVRIIKPEVKTYYNDKEASSFNYYPIEWRINGGAYTNGTNEIFRQAVLKVYVPTYLNIIDYGTSTIISPETTELVEVEGEQYNLLTYKLNIDNEGIINSGNSSEISQISIFTNIFLNTPNNSRPTVFAILDYDVEKIEDAVIKNFKPIVSDNERTGTTTVTIRNNSHVTTHGTINPSYIEKNGTYTFNMKAFNNSSSTSDEGYNYESAAIYYVLPYKNDSAYGDSSSNFISTDYKVKIPSLPEGYTAYYTDGTSSEIISSEVNVTSAKTYEWTKWNDTTKEISKITALKILKDTAFNKDTYFGSEDGITVEVTPVNSGVGDTYYNSFYIIADRPSNFTCEETEDSDCEATRNTRPYYTSTRTLVSVYNRQVSGFVFEDYNTNGLFDETETRLENIPVSVCKISKNLDTEEYSETDPTTYVSKDDECFADTITDIDGRFVMRGLTEGKYYVKYTFDSERYTVTDAYKTSTSDELNARQYNSKAYQIPDTNIAISSVLTYTKTSTAITNINLGLRIRKQFAVNINKFITKTEVTSNGETKTYEYDNADKVTISLRNPKNGHIRVTYSFVIENVKFYPGYVGIIVDKLPKGMTFDPTLVENQDWVLYDNMIYYNGLAEKLLIPNEKNYFSLVLDLDVTEGGSYVNVVAAKNLILMGDEIPEFIINTDESTTPSTEGNE